MKKIFLPILLSIIFISAISMATVTAQDDANPYFQIDTIRLADGNIVDRMIINGPPTPPPGYELTRQKVELSDINQLDGTVILPVPAFDWSFGCSATSGAMIAAYYDRNGYGNMYTGPTNSGVMPMDSSVWPDWTDGNGKTYGQCPLTASHQGLDGRLSRGSIDDYWVGYDSSANDPYITGGWAQHAWGDAIGDYMKTSQSTYGNKDGSTVFWTWNSSPAQLTCSQMVSEGISSTDGTYGRKLFYEARGYTVTNCYNQKTDNNGGGFTFAMYKAEIDAGRPVMLNLYGHTIVGIGYADPSTVYIHDTWDYGTYTMPWGGSYDGMNLMSVSVVNLQPQALGTLSGVVKNGLTSAPIVGATVVANSNQTTSITGGAYSLNLPAGLYTVTGSALGYQSSTVNNVSISSGNTTTLNFNLTPAAAVVYQPQTLEAAVVLGTTQTIHLSLTNNGGLTATYELEEILGTYQPNQIVNDDIVPQLPALEARYSRRAPEIIPSGASIVNSHPNALLLNEGFEGGVVPPDGWSEVFNNINYNWKIYPYSGVHSGVYAADVEYDPALVNQDEWLLTPQFLLTEGTLSFWSSGSVYWCRVTYNNCDLKVWIVVGDVGGEDDIFIGKADDNWQDNFVWSQSVFNLTPLLPGGPVRIGFEYIGNDGAEVLLDDITLDSTAISPEIPWLSETPVSGTISASTSQIIDITFDASSITQLGIYTGTLHILSNDPIHPDQSLPVTMTVIAPLEHQLFLPAICK